VERRGAIIIIDNPFFQGCIFETTYRNQHVSKGHDDAGRLSKKRDVDIN